VAWHKKPHTEAAICSVTV